MAQQHPITPSDELIGEWIDTDEGNPSVISRIATRAAQWGADQELQACCAELESIPSPLGIPFGKMAGNALRATRRPKPPSLKEQALIHFESFAATFETSGGDSDLIRRALEEGPDGPA
jgi:hypothetical protein